MKKSFLIVSLLIPVAIACAADPAKPKRDPGQIFKSLDANNDGALSYDEWKGGQVGHIDPSRMPEVFKKKDADGDGKLTLSEYMHIPPRATPKPAAATEKAAKKESKEEAAKQ